MNSNNSDTHSWRDPTDTTHGDCWIHVDIVSSSSRHWPRHTRRRTSCYTYKHCIRRGLDTHQQIVMRLWALADYYELSSWIILDRFFEKWNQKWMSCFLSKHWKCIIDALPASVDLCIMMLTGAHVDTLSVVDRLERASSGQYPPVATSTSHHPAADTSGHYQLALVSTC